MRSVAVCLFIVLGAAGVAAAQTPDDDPVPRTAEARRHLDPAIAFYRAQRYGEALVEFEAARRISPSPGIDLYIAWCEDRLHNYRAAVENYRRYLAAAPDAPDATKIRNRIRSLKAAVAASGESEAPPPIAPGGDGEAPRAPVGTEPPRKTFGIGTGLGIGYVHFTAAGRDLTSPALLLGDLWLDISLSQRVELQFWIPVLQLALARDAIWTDLFLKVYVAGEGAGFFLGPGVGVWHLWVTRSDGSPATGDILELPLRIGYEFASDRRGFGFSLGARLWGDFVFAEGQTATGWGAALEMVFTGYGTR